MIDFNFRNQIIELLKEGLTQQEIAKELAKKESQPNSISSVEKEMRKIRKEYGAKTQFHLGYLLGKEE